MILIIRYTGKFRINIFFTIKCKYTLENFESNFTKHWRKKNDKRRRKQNQIHTKQMVIQIHVDEQK